MSKSVPLTILLRFTFVVSAPPLVVLAALVISGKLGLTNFLIAYGLILLGSAAFAYPFLASMEAITRYVHNVARDKRAEPPQLSFLSMIFELSGALANLQRTWEIKRQQMESVITEREILVDTLPDILIMINDEKKVVRTNRAARAIFGQNLSGRPLSAVIANEELIDAVTSVVEDLRGREVEFRIEEPVLRDFLAIIERFPIPSPGGMSIVITMNDITELKSVEQMRADFVANASHEIRTPLACIAGFIETLQGPARDDTEAREEFLKLMAEQAERMKQLINDLLSLSKIEMNAHSIPTDPVSIPDVLRKVLNQIQHTAVQKNVTLRMDIPGELPPAKGEENELAQVVHNLVGNAIKYGHADSEVIISAQVTADLPPDQNMRNYSRVLMVTVRDRGEGIAREHLTRLTERFYRVDSARTRSIGGTGLGLAIVKGIITRHRGAITMDSVVGKGSTFSIYLPIYEEG